jgi:hypothetical protein
LNSVDKTGRKGPMFIDLSWSIPARVAPLA